MRSCESIVSLLVLVRLLTLLVVTRAFRTRTKTANRIPPSREPLPKCRIRVNRLCGLTIVRSPSTTKKLRNCRSKPRGNLPNRQQPTRGNVEGNKLRPIYRTFSAGLYHAGLHADCHPCFPSRSVFLSIPIASLMTLHAQPLYILIATCNPGLPLSLHVFSPGGHNTIFHPVFRLALLAVATFLHIKSLTMSRPPCCLYFNLSFPSSPTSPHLVAPHMHVVVRISSCTCFRYALLMCLFAAAPAPWLKPVRVPRLLLRLPRGPVLPRINRQASRDQEPQSKVGDIEGKRRVHTATEGRRRSMVAI